MIKIPGDRRGHPGDRGGARRGHQRERHADLQPRVATPRSSSAFLDGPRTARRRAAVTSRASRRSRRSSSAASTPRPIAGCPKAIRCAGKAAVANAKLAYQHVPRDVRGCAVGRARGEGRARAAAAVGVDVDEEPGVLADALRRHADRPRHGEHARAGVGRRARSRRRRTCAPTPCSKASTKRRRRCAGWPRPASTSTT